MKSDDVRQLHYVVTYNLETKVWEIDWDSMEARFTEGNYYDSRNGWSELEPEFEDSIIGELSAKLIGENS